MLNSHSLTFRDLTTIALFFFPVQCLQSLIITYMYSTTRRNFGKPPESYQEAAFTYVHGFESR